MLQFISTLLVPEKFNRAQKAKGNISIILFFFLLSAFLFLLLHKAYFKKYTVDRKFFTGATAPMVQKNGLDVNIIIAITRNTNND